MKRTRLFVAAAAVLLGVASSSTMAVTFLNNAGYTRAHAIGGTGSIDYSGPDVIGTTFSQSVEPITGATAIAQTDHSFTTLDGVSTFSVTASAFHSRTGTGSQGSAVAYVGWHQSVPVFVSNQVTVPTIYTLTATLTGIQTNWNSQEKPQQYIYINDYHNVDPGGTGTAANILAKIGGDNIGLQGTTTTSLTKSWTVLPGQLGYNGQPLYHTLDLYVAANEEVYFPNAIGYTLGYEGRITYTLTSAPVPESSSILGLAPLSLALLRRRRAR